MHAVTAKTQERESPGLYKKTNILYNKAIILGFEGERP